MKAQSGVLAEANSNALFLTLMLNPTAPEDLVRVRAFCGEFPAMTAALAGRDPAACLASVLAFGAGAWEQLFDAPRPAALRVFKAREQGARKAPSTPADLLLHIRSERRDLNYELAKRAREALGDAVRPVEEVFGFRYFESRDLTGFVDGTENPAGEERAQVALVAEGDLAGGSYVHLQRYVHDLSRWQRLAIAEQEGVIGRTKADDQELADDVKPATAHISRVVIEDEGEELEILRHSMPYGDTDEAGLVFIAYAASPVRFERMLDAMIYADAQGHYDHLMNYTRAVTGAAFFAPSESFLASIS